MKALLVFVALAAVPVLAANADLASAIKTGQRSAAVDMIAKKSADVNAAEADGTTALLWAASLNDADLASRLLRAGANPNVRNQLGSTPLAEAVLNSNQEMIKALALPKPEQFFELMLEYNIGAAFLPELFRMPDIPAGPLEHHPEGDLFTHAAHVLQRVHSTETG